MQSKRRVNVNSIIRQAGALFQKGRLTESELLVKRVLKTCPDNPDALHLLGIIAGQREDYVMAYRLITHAIRCNPHIPEYYKSLGISLERINRPVDALKAYDRATQLNPEFADVQIRRGYVLHNLGNLKDALAAFQVATRLQSGIAEAHRMCGYILKTMGRLEEASEAYRQAIKIDPDSVEAHIGCGNVLRELGFAEEALEAYGLAINIQPDSAEAHKNSGVVLTSLGRQYEAKISYRKALKARPNYPDIYRSMAYMQKVSACDSIIQEMECLYEKEAGSKPDLRIHLGFALGKAYGDVGDYDKSISYYTDANQLKRATFGYDIKQDIECAEYLFDLFTQSYISNYSNLGIPDDAPIFIVGMPRSGTTLLEQILSSHPAIKGAGELPFIHQLFRHGEGNAMQDYAAWLGNPSSGMLQAKGNEYLKKLHSRVGEGAQYYLDKMPSNFWLVGFMHLLLPNSRIIDVRRDAKDTCLSIYTQYFQSHHPYAYELTELGDYYNLYLSLMGHWDKVLPGRVYKMSYESLVRSTEIEVRNLLDYCDLPFDSRCLEHHKTSRVVQTASNTQVRQPIYKNSIGRWRHYGRMLQPLLSMLEES